jgi:parvulin-like peptidyl-prolyl cis-trans isomerase-like protein
MPRFGILMSLVLAAGLGACGSFRDLFSAHSDVAAQAGDQRLTPQRLSQIMSTGRGMRPNREAANFVTNLWVDYSLFAQAVANGKLPLDSASIAKAVWPELAELRGSHWHDSLMGRRSQISPNAADSTYQANQVRVLQHILFRTPQNATPPVRSAARKKAEGALARIKRGADFGQLASQVSEDPGSKRDNGFLPPSPKGKFVPAFDSAGWSLAPGAVSGVVETPFGYHIIKRPNQDSVRERINAYLLQNAGSRLDSIYMDSLAITQKLKLSKGAAAAMRAASENPEEARNSKKTLVSFKGGELTVGEFLRWLRALPPQYAAQLKQADDTMLTQFAKVLSQNVLLLRQADSAKIGITPEEWKRIEEHYRGQLDTLRSEMGLEPASLWDSTIAKTDRNKVAAMKVDQYFERLAAGKARLRPLPSALAALLRDRSAYRIYQAGLNRSVELAEAQRAKTDSAKAKEGPMQPAPGPAPIPGMGPGASGGKAPAAPQAPRKAGQPKSPPGAEHADSAIGKR